MSSGCNQIRWGGNLLLFTQEVQVIVPQRGWRGGAEARWHLRVQDSTQASLLFTVMTDMGPCHGITKKVCFTISIFNAVLTFVPQMPEYGDKNKKNAPEKVEKREKRIQSCPWRKMLASVQI